MNSRSTAAPGRESSIVSILKEYPIPETLLTASLIYDGRDRSFLEASSSILKSGGHSLFISENDDFLTDPTDQNRIDLTHAALDEVPIRLDEVRGRIARASTGLGPD